LPAPSAESLGSAVVRGIAWKGASQIALQVSRLAVAIILARLLAPHDFGLAGMVLIFSSLVIVFSDLALGAALVQRRDLTDDDCATVFWTGAGVGVFFTLAGIAVSGPLAAFYGEPSVKPLFAVLSLSFVVTALGTTQVSLLTREMDFRTLEIRLMLGTFVGAASGITVAALGGGAWAIVVQQLATSVVSTVLLWALWPWRPGFRYSLASLRQLWSFSANVFGQRLLYYLHRNIDNLLIGRFIGASALGVYTVAYNVMLVPFSRLAAPLQEVFFPAFARIQDDRARIATLWVRVMRMVAAISIPSLAGLVVVAPDFVSVVLGDRWHQVASVVRVLAWVGILQSLQTMNGDILQALGRAQTFFRYTVLFFCAHLLAFAVGLHWGIMGLAVGYAISSTVVEPLFAWTTARALGTPLWPIVKGLSGVAEATIGMLVVVIAARVFLLENLTPLERLLLIPAIGIATYVPLCYWRVPELFVEVRHLKRARRGAAEPALAVPATEALP
jgi:O-antigen/teichoic acid export membrane protein